MLKPRKTVIAVLLSVVSQLVVYSIAEKSMINDDDSFSRGDDGGETNTKDIYMSEAIRRGIERMINDSPYHRNNVQTQALIDRIGELLFHPPAKHNSEGDEKSQQSSSKKNSVDYIVTLEKRKNVKSNKVKMASNAKKDNLVGKVNKSNENVENKLATDKDKAETPKDDIKEASPPAKKKEAVVNEPVKHNEKSKTGKGNIGISDMKKKEDKESESKVIESKKRILSSAEPPFEGYMKKLAQDVNGVMGDATDMLRDTGKLIHGLKRVVKGASTLSSITNHAVKYAKEFTTEPENITVDFLEERAIIALLDAQKAANESKKAANLARIASAKAIDVERRVENAEPDLQDVKLVTPYIEATEILAGKAEKAAKLAKIEKEKTEKDFLIMNEQINRMNIKRKPETLQNSSKVPEKTYFYKKQKELEKELLHENEVALGTKKSIKSNHNVDSKSHSKELKNAKEEKHVTSVSKSTLSLKKGYDIGKEAISSIASELTNTLIQPQTINLGLSSKKDIARSPVKKHNIDSRRKSGTYIDGEKISSESIGQVEAYGHIMEPGAVNEKEAIGSPNSSNGENGEKENTSEENNKSQITSKPDAEQSFGAILRNSIENRDKISSYLNNQFSPKLALSEISSPELKVRTEENDKAMEPISGDTQRKGNVMSDETLAKGESLQDMSGKGGKPSVDEVLKGDLGRLAKEEKNVLLDYIDQDDSGSGDVSGNAERMLYKDDLSPDTSIVEKNNYHSENEVGRSKIPAKIPINESSIRSNIPINESVVSNNFPSPKPSTLDIDIEKPSHKKSTIEDPYDTLDPFGFNRLEDSKEAYNRRMTFIPDSGNYLHKIKERSYIPRE